MLRHAACPAQRGFTLLELLVVLLILAVTAGGVTLALRDGNETLLDQEATRLIALLEANRASARATGRPVFWATRPGGFAFTETPEASNPAPLQHWLDAGTAARIERPTQAGTLVLGPEPLLPAQQVTLSNGGALLTLGTDGLHPFAIEPPATAVGNRP